MNEPKSVFDKANLTTAIPVAFNGYVPVAIPAIRIPADKVRVGDVLILDSYVTPVYQITRRKVQGNNDGFHFSGDINVIRFGHELVSVIRRPVPDA